MSMWWVTLSLGIALVVTSGCSFFETQARVSIASQCQQSCVNVPANTQGQCIARCQ